jgi:hypothetical protein
MLRYIQMWWGLLSRTPPRAVSLRDTARQETPTNIACTIQKSKLVSYEHLRACWAAESKQARSASGGLPRASAIRHAPKDGTGVGQRRPGLSMRLIAGQAPEAHTCIGERGPRPEQRAARQWYWLRSRLYTQAAPCKPPTSCVSGRRARTCYIKSTLMHI